MMRAFVGRAVVALSIAVATLAAAQGTHTPADSILEARTTEIAKELRCPVCQGLSIQDSPSELSQKMRVVVKEQLAAGKTPDEVRAFFISKYGEWVLLAPQARGFNLVAYAAPALLFLAGLAFIVFVVRKWTAAGPDDDATSSAT